MAQTPGQEDAHGEPAIEGDIPSPPVPKASEFRQYAPFKLLSGTRYTLGWQWWPDEQGGAGFVTVRRGTLAMDKIVNRYPLTDEGWQQAWRELMSLDPATAGRIRDVLAQRAEAAERNRHLPGEMAEPTQEAAAAGERKPWRELSTEEKRERRQEWRAMSPQERRERSHQLFEAAQLERARKKGATFSGLGVRVRDGQVYPYPAFSALALGPLEGAAAELTDPTKAQMVRAGVASGLAFGAVIGPLALTPGVLRKSQAVAFVVCANGKIHEKKLHGTAAIRAAQNDAVKFNTLARSAGQPATAAPQPPPPTAGARLAEVTRLHDEGLLTDEEFQAKRAEIISQL